MSLPALIRAHLGSGLRSYATGSRIAEVGGSGNFKPVTTACLHSISTIFVSICVVTYFRGLEKRVDGVQATVDRLVEGR